MSRLLIAALLVCSASAADAATHHARKPHLHAAPTHKAATHAASARRKADTPAAHAKFKAVCHYKTIRIHTKHFIELRRLQRCF